MKKPSPAQLAVLAEMEFRQANTIERQPGGFWTLQGRPKEDWYAGTQTVHAMERAGLLVPIKFCGNRIGKFVVAYQRTEQP